MRGYTYWSLLDNFEWALGLPAPLRHRAVDRETFARTPKPSAAWLASVAAANALRRPERRRSEPPPARVLATMASVTSPQSGSGRSWPMPGIVMQLGPRHRRRGGLPAAQRDQGILLAVDDEERHVDAAQALRAVGRSEDGGQLARRALGAVLPVVGGPGPLAQEALVGGVLRASR